MPSVVGTQLRLNDKSRVPIFIYVDSKPSEKVFYYCFIEVSSNIALCIMLEFYTCNYLPIQ